MTGTVRLTVDRVISNAESNLRGEKADEKHLPFCNFNSDKMIFYLKLSFYVA